MNDTITLYQTVPSTWLDPWGKAHPVEKLTATAIAVRAGSFPHNNGYATTHNYVYVEDNGATYLAVPPIDFGASTYYQRRPSNGVRGTWRAKLPLRCIDKHGSPVGLCEDCGRAAVGDEFYVSGMCQVCLNGPVSEL